MQLAKPTVDIALLTNRLDPQLSFWRDEVGLAFHQTVPLVVGGQVQHRFHANGSSLKINHHVEPLPSELPSGHRGVVLAMPGVGLPKNLVDPDGNRLDLVPPGHEGVDQMAIRLAVTDLARHRRFYADALGLPEEAPGRFRAGETLILLEQAADAHDAVQAIGPGWRYITFQVMKIARAHARALAHGARETRPPKAIGTQVRFSFIVDPDGNPIELAQRADLAGSID